MAKPFLSIAQLTQLYPDRAGGAFNVYEDATFGTDKGAFVCIPGHSDCGKATLMITHDIDETILLADGTLLMTNGPGAQVAAAWKRRALT